jgi:hypothetical protein
VCSVTLRCIDTWTRVTWHCRDTCTRVTWRCRDTWTRVTWRCRDTCTRVALRCRDTYTRVTLPCRDTWTRVTWRCRGTWTRVTLRCRDTCTRVTLAACYCIRGHVDTCDTGGLLLLLPADCSYNGFRLLLVKGFVNISKQVLKQSTLDTFNNISDAVKYSRKQTLNQLLMS